MQSYAIVCKRMKNGSYANVCNFMPMSMQTYANAYANVCKSYAKYANRMQTFANIEKFKLVLIFLAYANVCNRSEVLQADVDTASVLT